MAAPGTGLDRPLLKQDIKDILNQLRTMTDDQFLNHQEIFAEKLSLAIDQFVRSGKVTTTGTAAAQTGLIL